MQEDRFPYLILCHVPPSYLIEKNAITKHIYHVYHGGSFGVVVKYCSWYTVQLDSFTYRLFSSLFVRLSQPNWFVWSPNNVINAQTRRTRRFPLLWRGTWVCLGANPWSLASQVTHRVGHKTTHISHDVHHPKRGITQCSTPLGSIFIANRYCVV